MKKRIMIVLGAIVALYLVGLIVFSFFIVPTTAIGNESVGFKQFDNIETIVNTNFETKQITINDDVVQDYKPKLVDLGVNIDIDKLSSDVKSEQTTWKWPFELVAKSNYELSDYIKFDEDVMKTELKSAGILGTKGRTKSTAANLKLNEETLNYEVVSSKQGNVVDNDKFVKNLENAIGNNADSISTAKSYKTISDQEKTMEDNAAKLNERINRNVSMKIEDEVIDVPKSIIASSLVVNDDGEVEVEGSDLYSYLYDQSLEYDFSEVGYGYHKVVESNVDPAYDEIVASLISDENTDIVGIAPVDEAEDTFKPTVDTDEKTYIEISISNQVMWVFKDDDLLVQTPVVTGSAADGWDTPTGDYTIISKETDKVLNGASVGFDYQVPVNYWMRLTNSGIGIHDIDWLNADNAWNSREVYVTQGSHGCINTPSEAMKLIYDSIPVGTPVYIRN